MAGKDKKSWRTPVITKIKLNPEQAVLSCCDSTDRAKGMGQYDTQCTTGPACGSGDSAPSS